MEAGRLPTQLCRPSIYGVRVPSHSAMEAVYIWRQGVFPLSYGGGLYMEAGCLPTQLWRPSIYGGRVSSHSAMEAVYMYTEWESVEVARRMFVGWLLVCLTSQQQASVSQGRISSDKFTCCHTEMEVADQPFYLTQSQYTDTRPTSPSADPDRVATGVPICKSLI